MLVKYFAQAENKYSPSVFELFPIEANTADFLMRQKFTAIAFSSKVLKNLSDSKKKVFNKKLKIIFDLDKTIFDPGLIPSMGKNSLLQFCIGSESEDP